MSISKWLDAIQITSISMEIEFESFGPRLQAVERKIENTETMMDWNNITMKWILKIERYWGIEEITEKKEKTSSRQMKEYITSD